MELVGPAGAGKSTLVRTIRSRDPEVRTDLSIWSLPRPRLVTNGLLFLPKLAALWRDYPGSLWTALHLAVRLKTLQQLLDRGKTRNCRALVVDIGPIFTLAWFRVYARHRTWNRWLDQWYPRAVVEGAADDSPLASALMRVAVVDIGTNSTRLLIAEVDSEGNVAERLRVLYGANAHLTMQSSPGVGTRISIELPLLQTDKEFSPASAIYEARSSTR